MHMGSNISGGFSKPQKTAIQTRPLIRQFHTARREAPLASGPHSNDRPCDTWQAHGFVDSISNLLLPL
jgi:hypothetical protein